MKNVLKVFAVLTAVITFFACQRGADDLNGDLKVTHKVTFVAGTPETKTSATIDGTVVNYSWKSTDEQENGTPEKFHVYENGAEATSIEAVLDDEGVMMVSAEFAGPKVEDPVYTCHFNSGVCSEQTLDTDGEYDQFSDVLVAKENDPDMGDATMFTFSFKREVAIAEATLKNLTAGTKVSKIRIESTDGTILAANYDITNRAFETTGSESIELNDLALAIDSSERTATFRFVILPVEGARLKVSVTTVDAENKIVGKYVKEFSKAISFTRGNLKKFNIALENDYLDPHIYDEGWFRVDDVRALEAGDVIRLGRPANEVVAGAYDGTKYFEKIDAQYSDSGDELVRLDLEKGAIDLTLGGSTDAWTLQNGGTYYVPGSDIKTATLNPGTWKISIASETHVASISDGTNTIKYNASSPRFKTYESGQMDIYIYKKYGNPEDKGLRSKCDVEFRINGTKVEAAEVTLGADNNVFPVVYTTSAGAKTFTSDNQAVAIVDENGVVTLVSDGATKIKVEVAETEDMKAGSAEYALTVNPAPAESVDLLNRAWTGIADKTTTYSSWTNKEGNYSGNKYAGNSAGDNNSIQLRSNNNNSGIVVTDSNGNKLARKVVVAWNSNTTSGRTLDIYGKDSAYTSAVDLYNSTNQGTKLGSIVCGTSTELEITGDYEFIGFRSNSGAMYLDNVQITWEEPKQLVSVAVSGAPTKVDYEAGEALNPAGLVVTGTYSDDSRKVITEGIEWTFDPETLTAGTTSCDVIASVGNIVSEVFTVTGLTVTEPVVLSSIAVSGTPTKTTYSAGDAFDPAGLVVTGTYSDASEKVITEGIEWTFDPEILSIGTTSCDVIASVGSVISDVYTVTGLIVTEPVVLSSIAVSGTPTKTTYNAGDAFDPAGLVVTGTYSDTSEKVITEGITWNFPASLTAGQTSCNVTATVSGITSATYIVTGLTVKATGGETNIVIDKTTTGSNSNSYVTSDTEFTKDAVKYKVKNWNPNTLQVRGNQSTAANNFHIYNTTAMPSGIKTIVVTVDGTIAANKIFVATGTSAKTSHITSGTQGTYDATARTLTFTLNTSDKYFTLCLTNGATSGTVKFTNIKIVY